MSMELWNLAAAWIGIALGALSGIPVGLMFHKDRFMGGYGSWRRRLARLGHISFFGIALINFAYVFSVRTLGSTDHAVPAIALLVAAVSMPAVCFLSAWRKPFRHLFFVPVLALAIGAIAMIPPAISAALGAVP